MIPLTQLAHQAVAEKMRPGDVGVDLTAGNGRDTLFMATCVGSNGHVYAFDIQRPAIQNTRSLLIAHSVDSIVTLISESHASWSTKIPIEARPRIKAIVMNLGYLPGGDKSLVTQTLSTLAAIDQALDWLPTGGLLSVLAYTGHPGGQGEADAVQSKLDALDERIFQISRHPATTTADAPVLYLVSKKGLPEHAR